MAKITNGEWLLVSKATQERLRDYAQGAQLCSRSSKTIKELQTRAANDRLRLARLHLKDAAKTTMVTTASHRATVSRAYYAMYHAVRAATYLSFGGDDHEAHSVLPTKLPPDFPDSETWKNKLKEARLDRNRADYDPYPAGDGDFRDCAAKHLREARALVKVTRTYIRAKS